MPEKMVRISRKLSVAQERLGHATQGFTLAAKVCDEQKMNEWRSQVHEAQEEILDLVRDAYRELDSQFEGMIRDEDGSPPLH